jgi:hypothetical protein
MFYLTVAILCLLGLGLFALILQDKFPLNGYPVLMMIPIFTIFVVNNIQLHSNRIAFNYLDEWMFTFTTLVVLVSFGAVLAGWMYINILPGSRRLAPVEENYPLDRLFTIGTACHVLSFIGELLIAKNAGGFFALYSKGHSFYGGADSDYLYLLFHLTFIGSVPYLQCLICNQKLPQWQKLGIVAVLGLQVFRALIVGQRGWLLNLVFIYLTVPFFCLGRWPRIRQVVPFLVPALALVIIFPAIRGSVYLGSQDWNHLPEKALIALQGASKGDTGSGITDEGDQSRVSSEFMLGAAIISAAWEKNSYTAGLSFYEMLTAPIPRQIWTEKPKNIALKSWIEVVNTHFPWSFNPGSAPTGIADVFLNLGFGCVVFWFGLGRLHRWVYDYASRPGSFYGQGLYVSLLLGSVFLFTQGLYFWWQWILSSSVFTTLFYAYARLNKMPKTTVNSLHSPSSTVSRLP